MRRSNDWERLHGAARRKKDREILAECERQMARQDDRRPWFDYAERVRGVSDDTRERRQRIADAFGREPHK